jgi:hypothetical protein
VTYTYNFIYLEGRDQEDFSSRPPQAWEENTRTYLKKELKLKVLGA